MDVRLDGRSAVITGGSKGLGLAIAEEYARSGADVAILARDQGTLNEAKDNAILLPHMYTGTCWGHFTMFNLREQDTAAIDAIYADALAS